MSTSNTPGPFVTRTSTLIEPLYYVSVYGSGQSKTWTTISTTSTEVLTTAFTAGQTYLETSTVSIEPSTTILQVQTYVAQWFPATVDNQDATNRFMDWLSKPGRFAALLVPLLFLCSSPFIWYFGSLFVREMRRRKLYKRLNIIWREEHQEAKQDPSFTAISTGRVVCRREKGSSIVVTRRGDGHEDR